MPTLEELYLTRTGLTGALPDVVPRDSQLRVLYAWNVDINNEEPWVLGAFSGELRVWGEGALPQPPAAGLQQRLSSCFAAPTGASGP
jgi:hypothetical protein